MGLFGCFFCGNLKNRFKKKELDADGNPIDASTKPLNSKDSPGVSRAEAIAQLENCDESLRVDDAKKEFMRAIYHTMPFRSRLQFKDVIREDLIIEIARRCRIDVDALFNNIEEKE